MGDKQYCRDTFVGALLVAMVKSTVAVNYMREQCLVRIMEEL